MANDNLTADRIASLIISKEMAADNLDKEVMAELVKRESVLAEQAIEIAAKCKHIREVLLANLDNGTHPIAGRKVIITVPRTIDKAAIADTYAEALYPSLYEVVLDMDAVKHHLSPADLDMYKVDGKRKLEIRS
jgi:hypothetical protein